MNTLFELCSFPMDSKNPIWSRRTNTSNLSLSTSQTDSTTNPRDYSSLVGRRNGTTSSHGGRANPFSSAMTSNSGGGLTSPTTGSGGFGIGTGAFASFGSAKTPKTPGNPFEMAMGSVGSAKTPGVEKLSKDSIFAKSTMTMPQDGSTEKNSAPSLHPLREPWVFWTRPPISKANGYIEYEKTLHPIAQVHTVEEFWQVYKHLKHPSDLPLVTDYHLFKKGIRPIWEDEENRKGGKWTLRMKKGIADRYWEEILMACVGDLISDGTDIVNGAVLSVRNGEDIISIWTATTDQKVLKVRDMMRSVLKCPTHTIFEYKSHDESLLQRQAIADLRREKADAAKRISRGQGAADKVQDERS